MNSREAKHKIIPIVQFNLNYFFMWGFDFFKSWMLIFHPNIKTKTKTKKTTFIKSKLKKSDDRTNIYILFYMQSWSKIGYM